MPGQAQGEVPTQQRRRLCPEAESVNIFEEAPTGVRRLSKGPRQHKLRRTLLRPDIHAVASDAADHGVQHLMLAEGINWYEIPTAGPPPQKSTDSTRPRESPAKARKLKLHTKPDSASVETKKQERAEYERRRNQTPERKEQARLLAQSRQRKAKELGKCRNCIQPAILGQTRCETCAENHSQSRRRSDANRRATTK